MSNLTDKGINSVSKVEWLKNFAQSTREVKTQAVQDFLENYESDTGDWTGNCGGKHCLKIVMKNGSTINFYDAATIIPEIGMKELMADWEEIHLKTGGYYAPKDGLIARNNHDGTAQVFKW